MEQNPYFDNSREKVTDKKREGIKVSDEYLPERTTPIKRTFNSALAEGIVFAEVLGRPVSKRRGRGRMGL